MKMYQFVPVYLFLSLLFLNSSAQKDSLIARNSIPPPISSVPVSAVNNDQQVYLLKPGVDIPLTAIAAGWSGYAFTKIYSKDDIPHETIHNLKKEDINGFDRWAADVYGQRASDISDYPFYASMPLPLLLLADRKIRHDAGKIGFLYLQAMSLTGLLYTGATYFVDRYRPYTYNPELDINERSKGGSKNSFFAGHVALVGTSTFFMAKVYTDYHPDSKRLKWILFGTAAVATGTTAYLRHRGGKHFPSDIALGLAVGTLSGILVPNAHKNKLFSNPNVRIAPFTTGKTQGLSLTYKIR